MPCATSDPLRCRPVLELRDLYLGVASNATKDDEHEAALEMLILVMLADGRLRVEESDEIEGFASDQEWDSDTFNYDTALGPAFAKVRAAMGIEGGVTALLDEIDQRIASRVLRAQLVAEARSVADADHDRAAAEDRVIAKIINRFG